MNPEVAAASASPGGMATASPPWPHGLPPQQQPQQPQQHPQANVAAAQLPQPTAAAATAAAGMSPSAQPMRPASHSASAGVGYHNGPYAHTGQQLPPELRPPQQPRPRIDPDQMPAPVQVREQDQALFGDKFFGTIERDRVPLATTAYIGLDQG